MQYGLTGYVWTGDMGRALRVADALEAGMIWLNSENVRHLPTPFGGMKSSGIGRDGGDYSFDFYMETKHVSLARGTHKIQKLGSTHLNASHRHCGSLRRSESGTLRSIRWHLTHLGCCRFARNDGIKTTYL